MRADVRRRCQLSTGVAKAFTLSRLASGTFTPDFREEAGRASGVVARAFRVIRGQITRGDLRRGAQCQRDLHRLLHYLSKVHPGRVVMADCDTADAVVREI